MLAHHTVATMCLLAIGAIPALSVSAEDARRLEYAIAVHGGAGSWANVAEADRVAAEDELRRALAVGRDLLAAGGSSVDAVERVVAALEDSPHFNAGRGATFNAAGRHELDASIMDGRDLSCGAVAGARAAKNPVKLARRVMADTKHVLLVGPGADAFANSIGAECVDADYFWTPEQRAQWEKFQERAGNETADDAARKPAGDAADHHGTVGCVALDRQGSLAAATSTGGLEGKLPGRVGDSPIIGAGTYADDATCAVSCTGVGEEFIRRAIAYDVAARMKYAGATLDAAVAAQFDERLKPGDGGLIALDRLGRTVIRFNTPAMARGVADSTGRVDVVLGP